LPPRRQEFQKVTVFSFKNRLHKAGATIAGFCRIAGVTSRTGQHYSGGTRRIPSWVGFVLDRIESDEAVAEMARRLSREASSSEDEGAATESDAAIAAPDAAASKKNKPIKIAKGSKAKTRANPKPSARAKGRAIETQERADDAPRRGRPPRRIEDTGTPPHDTGKTNSTPVSEAGLKKRVGARKKT
jgi:hypothetical protein